MRPSPENREQRCYLFLQGPLSSYFSEIAAELKLRGQRVLRVNFCGNDVFDWKHAGAIQFRARPDKWPDFLSDLLKREAVDAVLFHGDRRYYHQVAADICRSAGVEIFASELGYLRPDWMTLEHGACSVLSHFPNDAEKIKRVAEACPPVDGQVVYPGEGWRQVSQELRFTALNTLLMPMFPNYRNHRPESRLEVYSGWLAARWTAKQRMRATDDAIARFQKSNTPYFVVALQLDGDFQIREHSPFADMGEAIDFIAKSFAAHAPAESRLVLKTHPLEYRFKKLQQGIVAAVERHGLHNRVVRLDGGNLKALAGAARGFVTVNSSAGLEALGAGCPTMAIMPTIYDIAGLTHQGSLDTFWQAAEKPDPTVYDHLVRALAGTIQLRGTIYNRAGLKAAATAAADKLVANSVNDHGAFVSPPPRLAKARHMGVTYSSWETETEPANSVGT